MMLRSAIIITHIPEEQVAYRQCTRPSLPPAKAWLREARAHLRRERQRSNLFQLGDSGFTEEDEEYDDDDDATENREIVWKRILSWRTEGTYEVFRHVYG